MNHNQQIASYILQQLGGTKFVVMTGAKNFVAGSGDDHSLYFRLAKRTNGITHVIITLDVNDTYRMTFTYTRLVTKNGIKSPEAVTVYTVDNVYADQLQTIFTEQTGLATRL